MAKMSSKSPNPPTHFRNVILEMAASPGTLSHRPSVPLLH